MAERKLNRNSIGVALQIGGFIAALLGIPWPIAIAVIVVGAFIQWY